MMKFLVAAAALLAVAATVHADNACYTSCDQECLRSGSLARECQLECTQECPATGGSTKTCVTQTDCSAHDACVTNDIFWLYFCSHSPLGPLCTAQYVSPGGVAACPACVTTTVCS